MQNAERRILMLTCSGCGAHFPYGAWNEHLPRCAANPERDRSAEILEGLSRRMADLTEIAAYEPL